jgi:hypothetical protein
MSSTSWAGGVLLFLVGLSIVLRTAKGTLIKDVRRTLKAAT